MIVRLIEHKVEDLDAQGQVIARGSISCHCHVSSRLGLRSIAKAAPMSLLQ